MTSQPRRNLCIPIFNCEIYYTLLKKIIKNFFEKDDEIKLLGIYFVDIKKLFKIIGNKRKKEVVYKY